MIPKSREQMGGLRKGGQGEWIDTSLERPVNK